MNILKKKTKLTGLLIFAAMLICSAMLFGAAALPTAYAEATYFTPKLAYEFSGGEYTVKGVDTNDNDWKNMTAEQKVNIKIVIPATYNNGTNGEFPVTAIADNAFDCGMNTTHTELKNVTITSLDFSGATNLKEIGQNAFKDCSSLSGDLIIPNSVTKIREQAFHNCSNLRSLKLGNQVAYIDNSAFRDCSSLSGELVIPDSLEQIQYSAFSGCTNLSSLKLGNKIFWIKEYAFSGCTNLSGELVIPNSVTNIDKFAFSGCRGLTSLKLGNRVGTISESAFDKCSSLDGAIVIPNSVYSIGNSAFNSCSALDTVYLPERLIFGTYGTGVFSNMPGKIVAQNKNQYDVLKAHEIDFTKEGNFTYETDVTFDANGGTISGQETLTQQKLFNSSYTFEKNDAKVWADNSSYELPTASKLGFKFESYNTQADGKGQQLNTFSVVEDNKTYYAQYTANPVDSIAVTTVPTKTEYKALESFDPTGMVITATFKDGSTQEVTDYTVVNGDKLQAGTSTVTVSVTIGGITLKKNIDILVNAIQLDKPTLGSGTYTYNGSEQTVTLNGLDSAKMSVTGNKGTNANTYNAVVSLNDKTNYSWTGGSVNDITLSWSIDTVNLTVTANDNSIFRGEAPSASGVTYNGLVGGEDETVLSGTLGYSYNYSQGGAAGKYTITPNGLTSDNYEITFVSGTLTVKELLRIVYLGGVSADNAHDGTSAENAVADVNTAIKMVADGGTIVVCGDTAPPTVKTLVENKSITFTNTDGVNSYANAVLRTYYPTFLSNVTISNVLWQDVYTSKQCEVGKDVTLILDTVTVSEDLIRYIVARDTGAHLMIRNSVFSGRVSYLCNFDTVTLDNSVATALYSKKFATDAGNFTLKNGSTLSVSMDIKTLTSTGEGNTVEARKLVDKKLAPVTVLDAISIELGKPIFLTNWFEKYLKNGVPFLQSDNPSFTMDKFALSSADSVKFALYMADNTIYAMARTVSEIVITPSESELQRNQTLQFSATVKGTFKPSQEVTWSVNGGKVGTSIDASGLLTVASDEAFTALTITAVSVLDNTKSVSVTVTVVKRNLSEAVIGDVERSFTYNGSEYKPTVSIADNGNIAQSDYTFSYLDNINAGTATVTITATEDGNYTGSVTRTFTINKATQVINTSNVNLDYTYTGALQNVGGGATVGDLEQTVNYTDNTFTTVAEGNGKVVTISVAETQNYLANSVTVTLIVQKANYDISGITFTNAAAEYDGQSHSLTVTGALPTGADGIPLTVFYAGSATFVTDGTVNVTATFATTSENYNVPAAMTATITITPKEVTLNWAGIDNLVYSGEAKTATATALGLIDGDACSVTVSLTDGTDNVNAGKFTYTATELSNRNYKLPTNVTSGEYTITAKTLTKEMIADIASVVYNGQAQQPNVTVSDGDLLKDTDYELAFSGNIDAGTATVTITATANGNYKGTVTRTFTIQKAEIDMSGITFADKTVVHNGTAFGIEITGELPSNVTVTYSENETAAGIYTMTATFAATSENYIVPAAMTATLTIRYDKQEQPGDDGEGGTVIIESPEGIDPNYKLEAKDVTKSYAPVSNLESIVGKNQEIKQVYDVKLLDANSVSVQPDGLLTIRLLLAENYRNLTELKVYVMDGTTMTELTATRDGNYMVFSTAQLAEYAIVGEVLDNGLSASAIACIVLASILILLLLVLLILFLLRKDKSQGFRAYCAGLFKKNGKNAKNEFADESSAICLKNQDSAENNDDLKE